MMLVSPYSQVGRRVWAWGTLALLVLLTPYLSGCGTASVDPEAFVEDFCEEIACPEDRAFARSFLLRLTGDPRFGEWIEAHTTCYPFRQDLTWCIRVFEYLGRQPLLENLKPHHIDEKLYILRLRRQSRQNLTQYHWTSIEERWGLVLGALERRLIHTMHYRGSSPLPVTYSGLADALESAGLRTVEWDDYGDRARAGGHHLQLVRDEAQGPGPEQLGDALISPERETLELRTFWQRRHEPDLEPGRDEELTVEAISTLLLDCPDHAYQLVGALGQDHTMFMAEWFAEIAAMSPDDLEAATEADLTSPSTPATFMFERTFGATAYVLNLWVGLGADAVMLTVRSTDFHGRVSQMSRFADILSSSGYAPFMQPVYRP